MNNIIRNTRVLLRNTSRNGLRVQRANFMKSDDIRRFVPMGKGKDYLVHYTFPYPNLLMNGILTVFLAAIAYNCFDGSDKAVPRQTDGKPSAVQKEDKKFVQLYQKGEPLPFKNEIIGQTINEEELKNQVKKLDYTSKTV